MCMNTSFSWQPHRWAFSYFCFIEEAGGLAAFTQGFQPGESHHQACSLNHTPLQSLHLSVSHKVTGNHALFLPDGLPLTRGHSLQQRSEAVIVCVSLINGAFLGAPETQKQWPILALPSAFVYTNEPIWKWN